MNITASATVHDSMRKNHKASQGLPRFPALLAIPIASIPENYSTAMIVKSLNILLAQALQEGELDFLQDMSVSVAIIDLKLKFALSLAHEKLVASDWQDKDDLNLSGHLYDFMLLASRQEDSDTLFFHRRLKMEGNTDLGLEVKNLLDGMEMNTVRFYKPLDFALKHSIKIFEKLFK
jgi:predicted lipid carrier protein YhbT